MFKIIFLNNWGEPYDKLLQRYSKQTPNNKGIWKNLRGVTNIKDADFYVVLGGYNKQLPQDKTIFIKREPGFISKSKQSYKYNIDWYDRHCGITWWINKTYDELKKLPYPTKSKKISCVVSSKHSHRNNLIKKIVKEYPNIDLYGKGHNKEFYGDSYKGVLNYDGNCKIKGLLDYEYSVVLENSSQDNYFTEKIADAYLSWCVPIYKGCPNINNFFPSNSYYLIDSENNMNNILDKSVNIKELSKARDLILDEYNIWEVIHKKIQEIKDNNL